MNESKRRTLEQQSRIEKQCAFRRAAVPSALICAHCFTRSPGRDGWSNWDGHSLDIDWAITLGCQRDFAVIESLFTSVGVGGKRALQRS